jgi:hypothetical protein
MATKHRSGITDVPRGATGFKDSETEPLPVTDSRLFVSACHEAARRAGYRVVEITRSSATRSFHSAVLTSQDRKVAVLGHGHLPLMAIAQVPAAGSTSVVFADGSHELELALEASETFRLLRAEELRLPLEQVDLSRLDPAERRQIAYWSPETLGELLFNYWD